MTVSFAKIPTALRVPLFYAEVDNSKANNAVDVGRTLIIGQMTTGGDAAANVPVRCMGLGDAKSRFGVGSMLANMVDWYRKRDSFGELWCVPLADAGGGTAATGSIAFTGTATAAGILALYVAGTLLPVTVTSGMTAAQLATAVGAAINAATDLPATATVSTATVTIAARHKGVDAGDVDVRLNYRGTAGGEATPAGITATVTALSGGATNPTLTTALANLGDAPFDFIVFPYTDSTSLDAIKAFLDDSTGRWSWQAQVYGHFFCAYRGTVSGRTTLGLARNDQHGSIMGVYDTPTSAFMAAANVAGAAASSLRSDPALPLQTLATDILAPPIQSRDSLSQRNTLLYSGISTTTVDADGTVRIEALITTYQKNAQSQADDSYLYVERLFTLMAVLRQLKTVVTSKFARVKLADNGTRVLPGSNTVTPNTIRGEIIAAYREIEGVLVENGDAFADGLIVERDATNRRRVNVLWPGDLIDGMSVFALLAQFRA